MQSILIYGNTPAAYLCALTLAEKGFRPQLFYPVSFLQSPYSHQEEGLAFPKSLESFFKTRLEIGRNLYAKPEVLESVFEFAPHVIALLERAGLTFERNSEGVFKKRNGSLHTKEQTWLNVLWALQRLVLQKVKAQEITLLENWDLVSTVVDPEKNCHGVVVQNTQSLKTEAWDCHALVLCEDPICFQGTDSSHPFSGLGGGISTLLEHDSVVSHLEYHDAYSLGGLWTNSKQRTSITNIFAASGSASSSHGAKSCYGNRLLFDLFSGYQATLGIETLFHKFNLSFDINLVSLEQERQKQLQIFESIQDLSGHENIYRLYQEAFHCFQNLFQKPLSSLELNQSLDKVYALKERSLRLGLLDKSSWCNQEVFWIRKWEGFLNLCEIQILSSLFREESRGIFQREDFPEENSKQGEKISKAKLQDKRPDIFFEKLIAVTSDFGKVRR